METAYSVKAIVVKPWFRKPRLKFQVVKHHQVWEYGAFDCDLRDVITVVATFNRVSEALDTRDILNAFKGEKP